MSVFCEWKAMSGMKMKVPASSFYRHKEGRSTCTGRSQKSSSSPQIGGSGRSLLKVHCGALESMAPGVAVVLRSSLALRGSRRRPDDSCG